MYSVDIHILEERKNLFNLLRSLETKCLSGNIDRERAFSVLMKVWDTLTDPLFNYGYWHDFNDFSSVVIRVAQELNQVSAEAQALNETGWVNMEWGHYDIAEVNFLQALQKYEFLKDAFKKCRTLRYLGVLYHRKKEMSKALSYYGNALSMSIQKRQMTSEVDSTNWNAWVASEAELRNMFGIYYLDQKDFNSSYEELSFSLNLYRSISDPYYEYYLAAPLLNLGKWHFVQKDYNNSKKYYTECLDLSRKINRIDTVAGALLRLATVAEAEGDDAKALELATEAEKTAATEITITREAAARFKEKILNRNKA